MPSISARVQSLPPWSVGLATHQLQHQKRKTNVDSVPGIAVPVMF